MSKVRISSGLLFLALAGVLFASSPLLAQFHSTIEGTVTDSTGAAVLGAQVALTNQDTGVSQTSISNGTGAFHFPSLGLGTYTLTASKSGFQSVKQENIVLAAEETRTIPLVLKIGEVQETVTITEDTAAIQLAESKISSGIASQEITELPLTGRNLFNLVSLTPGVTGTGQASGTAFDNTIFSLVNGGQTNANGQRGDANAFYLDNTYATSNPDPGVYNLTPNPESIAEVHVSVNDYSAEYGHSSGLVIQAVTKSGTNRFHGSLFEYHTDNHLQALPFSNPVITSLAVSRRNEFGGSIGGPIQKDKWFGFFSWDQLRSAAAGTLGGTVETPDFVNFMTTNFPNNLSTQLLTKYPSIKPNPNPTSIQTVQDLDPNCATVAPVAGIPCTLDVLENVSEGVAPKDNGLQWTFRIDRYFRDGKDRINGSFFRKTPDVIGPNIRPAFDTLNAFVGITNYSNIDWTHTFSPNLLNDAAFGITRISGLGVCNNCQVPPINIAAMPGSGFGTGFAPAEFLQNDFHWRDVVSYNHGKHAWKAGLEIFRDQENDLFSGPQLRPSYNFINNSPTGAVNSLFDFANDTPDNEGNINFNLITGGPASQNVGYRTTTYGFFVQDDYKIKSNLSINAGLRWDFSSNPNEVNGRMTNIILGQGSNLEQEIAGASVRVTPKLLADHRIGYFAPRLGFTWDPTKQGKLSIRGGMGVFFNRWPNKVWSDAIRSNPPFEGGPITATIGTAVPPAYGLCQLPVNPFNCDIPSNLPVGLNPGGGALPAAGISSAGGTLPDLKYSYNIARFIGVQYAITPSWVVEGDYSGSHDVHLYVNEDMNRCLGCFDPNTGSQIGFLPNPNFLSLNLTSNSGWSYYNGGSFSVRHKFNRSFTVQAAYTVGHTVDNVDSVQPGHNASYGVVYSPYDPNFQKGTAAFDIKNAFILHGVWELPKLSRMNTVVRSVLGGWQLTGAASFQGGYPYTVRDCNRSPDGNGSPPDVDADIGGPDCVLPDVTSNYIGHGCGKQGFINGCLDPTQFSDPCPLTAGGQLNCTNGVWLGNVGRNTFRGPGYANVDFSSGKYFNIPWFLHEGARLQIRGDFFNLFNRTNLNPATMSTDLALVGGVSTDPNFTKALGAFNPRTIQVAARIEF
jgi:Carboxypeptidase regulatory-like domain/TonB dependent receptor